MKSHLKEFFFYFAVQVVNYGVLTINFVAVARHDYRTTLLTDALASSLGFWVIRKIAKDEDSIVGWLGYLAGSLVGTFLGLKFS